MTREEGREDLMVQLEQITQALKEGLEAEFDLLEEHLTSLSGILHTASELWHREHPEEVRGKNPNLKFVRKMAQGSRLSEADIYTLLSLPGLPEKKRSVSSTTSSRF